MTDLTFSLMKEQLALRAKITSLFIDVRAFLQKNFLLRKNNYSITVESEGDVSFAKNTSTTSHATNVIDIFVKNILQFLLFAKIVKLLSLSLSL